MKNRRERKHADGRGSNPDPPVRSKERSRGGSSRGPAPFRAHRAAGRGVARDRPPVDLGVEMMRVELQDLLADDPDCPLTDLGEILRYVYSRDEMTHEERIACRMRIHASKALRDAYLEILGRVGSSGRRRTPAGRAARMSPSPPDDRLD